MSYDYVTERPRLFGETGSAILLDLIAFVTKQRVGGVFQTEDAISHLVGDTWVMLAALDFLAERGDIKLVTRGPRGQQDIWRRMR